MNYLQKLWVLETCILANNDLCEKVVSSLESPNILDEIFKVTFFIQDFDLLSCEIDFTFEVLYWTILNWYYIEAKNITYFHGSF